MLEGLTSLHPGLALLAGENVVVRADTTDPAVTIVDAMDPEIMVQVTDNADLKPVAEDAATRLRQAITALNSIAT